MINPSDSFPVRAAIAELDSTIQNPNALRLDERYLGRVATALVVEGVDIDRLKSVYNENMATNNPILSHHVAYGADQVRRRNEGNVGLFNRGVALAYLLIDEASGGSPPLMGIGSFELAGAYLDRFKDFEELRLASDRILTSQTALNQAFNRSVGKPAGPERDLARFGAGILVLGTIAAQHFGGTGVETWSE